MKFIADLHIHSKYSRATAKNLDFENLYIAAQLKGITVVGTGDFTHPAWFGEIREKLEPAEPGLFKLKQEYAVHCDQNIPPALKKPVRFMLESEISNIYKKDGRTRKNHNLIFVPDMDTAEQINTRLDHIGNIKSDGRPILGLDAKHLLEIIIDISDRNFLIPAHIWTPWFSLLGSKSGFDSIEACFEDLTEHIFAVETGLSSDPAMNWRVSDLDRVTLVSNSDAHSPMKLGREANLFDTKLSYDAIRSALENKNDDGFLGTYEFYPEEGKYHFDGHRKCGICFHPEESIKHSGNCPVCGKPLTLGVLYRVEELANREEKDIPEKKHEVHSIIPLDDILSELLGCGPKTKKVQNCYYAALESLGSEFDILHNISVETLKASNIPLLGPAIEKMRENKIHLIPGFDGEFGKIKIFTPEEKETLQGQKLLFNIPEKKDNIINKPIKKKVKNKKKKSPKPKKKTKQTEKKIAGLEDLNPDQIKAITHKGSPLLIVAGPGTGKTLTITHKIAYLINERGIPGENILAVTFTNKAAHEMKSRVDLLLDHPEIMPYIGTFHALCFNILKNIINKSNYTIIDDNDRQYLVRQAVKQVKEKYSGDFPEADRFADMIVSAKQQILDINDDLSKIAEEYACSDIVFQNVYQTYQDMLSIQGVYDFEDLIFKVVRLLESEKNICKTYQEMYPYIFVDEYQDLNHGQYRIIRALAGENSDICVIGDPDQSIYGFRGSDVRYFKDFVNDYPDAEVIHLTRNYRSTETILEASYHVIRDQHKTMSGSRVYSEINGKKTIDIMNLSSEKAEAVAIGKIIEENIGGMGFYSIDFGKTGHSRVERSFSDFAVLYRTGAQGQVFADQFEKAGIPFQMVSRQKYFAEKGISELLSLMKIITGHGTYADLEKVIQLIGVGIGEKTIHVFKKWCFSNNFTVNEALVNAGRFPVQDMKHSNQLKLYDFIEYMGLLKSEIAEMTVEQGVVFLKDRIPKLHSMITGDKRKEDIYIKIKELSISYKDCFADFFDMISLQVDADTYEYQDEKVALMTMHASKGLEFPIVFVAGCEENLIPYKKNGKEIDNIEEEKRLFYVAMTRAKEHLYLTYADKRNIFGKTENQKLSFFVDDIEKELTSHQDAQANKVKKENKCRQVQLELF